MLSDDGALPDEEPDWDKAWQRWQLESTDDDGSAPDNGSAPDVADALESLLIAEANTLSCRKF